MKAGLLTCLSGPVAAVFAAAAGLVGLSAAPASAAQCGQGGVSVVVDFNRGAGGGLDTACDSAGGGKYASAIFRESGFPLQYVGGSGGFVCRVKSAPSNADCTRTAPADAYWGLFWAKKGSTSWIYSNSGVSTLKIPEGGAVAFAFQNGGSTDFPGVSPSARSTPAPAPTKAPTKKPTKKPTTKPTTAPTKAPGGGTKPTRVPKATRTPAGSSSSSTAPTSTSSAAARASGTASPSASSSASASASASTVLEPDASGGASPDADTAKQVDGAFTPADEPSGLPTWVPIMVIVALAGAAGGAVWWRRRTGAA